MSEELLGGGGSDAAVAEAMAIRARDENFPVALRLLPSRPRQHLLAVYGFARMTDDIGDLAPRRDRLRLLDELESGAIAADVLPGGPADQAGLKIEDRSDGAWPTDNTGWPSTVRLRPQPPISGRSETAAAEDAPGRTLTRAINCWKKALCWASFGYFDRDSGTSTVKTFSGLMPAFTCSNFAKLRTIRPAPTSSTNESATSATTSKLRSRL